MLNRKRFYKSQRFLGFSTFSDTLVTFLNESMILALTFTKSLCLVLFRPAETSLMLWLYGNRFIKRAALRSESNEMSEKNVLQNLAHAFHLITLKT